MSPQEVLEFAAKNSARQLDLRFSDIPGLQHHISYPISELEPDSFENGFGIDGSSIRGWAAINESDMLLIPDPATAFMDPFTEIPTLVMTGDVKDPITRQNYETLKAAILSALRNKELTHTELLDQLNKSLKNKFSGNISWYGETVKLDLEARKMIERTSSKPQKYRLNPN